MYIEVTDRIHYNNLNYNIMKGIDWFVVSLCAIRVLKF